MPSRFVRLIPLAAAHALSVTLLLATHAAGQDDAPRPMASVPGGPAGSEVFISMAGGRLEPGARVSLGFGGLSGGYELVARAVADGAGVLAANVTVPSWAEPGLVYFFFLNVGGGVRIFSDPFIVTAPGGLLQVMGSVTEVGEGCALMTGPGDARFALSGLTTPLSTGARITVDGVLGVAEGAEGGAAACAGRPGIPLRVRVVRGL
jgi:hypothetical protein